jgi:hypothetical protein
LVATKSPAMVLRAAIAMVLVLVSIKMLFS